jgi:exocyst complex component 4
MSTILNSEERLGEDSVEAKGIHRLLVPADAFHVSILFVPTLAFLDRMQEILPTSITGEEERGFSAFLEDFFAVTYLPLLEEKVTAIFQQATANSDAFAEDSSSGRPGPPMVKCVSSVLNLIRNLCTMLRSSPFHRESYSRLIISVMEHFLSRCSERFGDLVARQIRELPDGRANYEAEEGLKTAAIWAKRAPLLALLAQMRQDPVSVTLTCSSPD